MEGNELSKYSSDQGTGIPTLREEDEFDYGTESMSECSCDNEANLERATETVAIQDSDILSTKEALDDFHSFFKEQVALHYGLKPSNNNNLPFGENRFLSSIIKQNGQPNTQRLRGCPSSSFQNDDSWKFNGETTTVSHSNPNVETESPSSSISTHPSTAKKSLATDAGNISIFPPNERLTCFQSSPSIIPATNTVDSLKLSAAATSQSQASKNKVLKFPTSSTLENRSVKVLVPTKVCSHKVSSKKKLCGKCALKEMPSKSRISAKLWTPPLKISRNLASRPTPKTNINISSSVLRNSSCGEIQLGASKNTSHINTLSFSPTVSTAVFGHHSTTTTPKFCTTYSLSGSTPFKAACSQTATASSTPINSGDLFLSTTSINECKQSATTISTSSNFGNLFEATPSTSPRARASTINSTLSNTNGFPCSSTQSNTAALFSSPASKTLFGQPSTSSHSRALFCSFSLTPTVSGYLNSSASKSVFSKLSTSLAIRNSKDLFGISPPSTILSEPLTTNTMSHNTRIFFGPTYSTGLSSKISKPVYAHPNGSSKYSDSFKSTSSGTVTRQSFTTPSLNNTSFTPGYSSSTTAFGTSASITTTSDTYSLLGRQSFKTNILQPSTLPCSKANHSGVFTNPTSLYCRPLSTNITSTYTSSAFSFSIPPTTTCLSESTGTVSLQNNQGNLDPVSTTCSSSTRNTRPICNNKLSRPIFTTVFGQPTPTIPTTARPFCQSKLDGLDKAKFHKITHPSYSSTNTRSTHTSESLGSISSAAVSVQPTATAPISNTGDLLGLYSPTTIFGHHTLTNAIPTNTSSILGNHTVTTARSMPLLTNNSTQSNINHSLEPSVTPALAECKASTMVYVNPLFLTPDRRVQLLSNDMSTGFNPNPPHDYSPSPPPQLGYSFTARREPLFSNISTRCDRDPLRDDCPLPSPELCHTSTGRREPILSNISTRLDRDPLCDYYTLPSPELTSTGRREPIFSNISTRFDRDAPRDYYPLNSPELCHTSTGRREPTFSNRSTRIDRDPLRDYYPLSSPELTSAGRREPIFSNISTRFDRDPPRDYYPLSSPELCHTSTGRREPLFSNISTRIDRDPLHDYDAWSMPEPYHTSTGRRDPILSNISTRIDRNPLRDYDAWPLPESYTSTARREPIFSNISTRMDRDPLRDYDAWSLPEPYHTSTGRRDPILSNISTRIDRNPFRDYDTWPLPESYTSTGRREPIFSNISTRIDRDPLRDYDAWPLSESYTSTGRREPIFSNISTRIDRDPLHDYDAWSLPEPYHTSTGRRDPILSNISTRIDCNPLRDYDAWPLPESYTSTGRREPIFSDISRRIDRDPLCDYDAWSLPEPYHTSTGRRDPILSNISMRIDRNPLRDYDAWPLPESYTSTRRRRPIFSNISRKFNRDPLRDYYPLPSPELCHTSTERAEPLFSNMPRRCFTDVNIPTHTDETFGSSNIPSTISTPTCDIGFPYSRTAVLDQPSSDINALSSIFDSGEVIDVDEGGSFEEYHDDDHHQDEYNDDFEARLSPHSSRTQRNSSNNQNTRLEKLCVICLDNKKSCALTPCGHRAYCEGCCLLLLRDYTPCCLCRKLATGYLKIFV